MLRSMTGFASAKGTAEGFSWAWELRSVNSKGLDLRIRVPDWIEGLEPALRAALTKALTRGSVALSLRIQKLETEEAQVSVNPTALQAVLTAMAQVEQDAMNCGVSLSPSNSVDILGVRGVLDTTNNNEDTAKLRDAIVKGLPALLKDFNQMRNGEGEALDAVLRGQLAEMTRLTQEAAAVAETRKGEMANALRDNLNRILENAEGVDEARLTQELALIAVKSDVTEEIDRLHAHVDAAGTLIAKGSPIGRKLDFLMQEFNREANTLCSKAQNVELTRIGLDLKALIDQMREQVQNVE